MQRFLVPTLLISMLAVSACKREGSEPGATSTTAKATKKTVSLDDPRVVRFRADLKKLEPSATLEKLEADVGKFTERLERAATIPYPKDHAACQVEMPGQPADDCTLVAGDVLRPEWFRACHAAGGSLMKSSAPLNTPLQYDTALCTKIFGARK